MIIAIHMNMITSEINIKSVKVFPFNIQFKENSGIVVAVGDKVSLIDDNVRINLVNSYQLDVYMISSYKKKRSNQ